MKEGINDLVGIASDYSDPDNWLYLPQNPRLAADVIFLYPTAYVNPQGGLISSIKDQGMRTLAQKACKRKASVFANVGNIFIPYYRQVNAAKFDEMSFEEIRSSSLLAPRTDLYAALDYYFANYNNGRAYILAGHSQGSIMLQLILGEYMKKHPEYYERMIASYMIGYSLTQDFLDENPHLRAAQKADDLGVIISWNTLGAENSGTKSLVILENARCINPLNWKNDSTYAAVTENLGSYLPDENGVFSLVEGIADARIDADLGVLICESIDPQKYGTPGVSLKVLGANSYHSYDYELYYANIRQNAILRIEKWLKNK